MVGKHHLCGQTVIAVTVVAKQWKKVQPHGAVPVEELGIAMVFLKKLSLYGVGTYHLSLEIIITCGVLGIHQRCGRIGLDGILEHTPVCLVSVDYSWRDIGGDGEEATLRSMHNGSTCTIFTTVGTEVDTLCITIIGTHTVVAFVVATA